MKHVQERRLWLYVSVLLSMGTLVFVNAAWGQRPAKASAAQGATVALAVPKQARPGTLISVDIVASNVQNLAGYQATVEFDAAQVRLVGASVATDLKRGGRDFLPLGPLERPGAVVLGAATCPTARCSDPRPEQARRIVRGIDGQLTLGTVRFYVSNPGQYPLTLKEVKLVDPQGRFQLVTSASSTLDVAAK